MILWRSAAEPRFLSRDDQPHDTNVTDGATLTFKCYAYAKPEASVVWLRNGLPLDRESYHWFNVHKLCHENVLTQKWNSFGNNYIFVQYTMWHTIKVLQVKYERMIASYFRSQI